MKQKGLFIFFGFLILVLILFLTSIFFKKQLGICPVGEEKIFNNCNCKYECRPKEYIGGVCDRLCPQEVQNYEAN